MNNRRLVRIDRAACLVAIAFIAASIPGGARADGEGASVWLFTIVHLNPNSSSGPLTLSEVAGQPVNQPQAGSGVKVLSANTVLLSYERYLTDQVSWHATVGWPPTHELSGTGTLETVGVIGDGQQLSPTLVLRYHFLAPDAPVRPYVGLGINYTWYRKLRITNDAFRDATFGPNATTDVSASASWNAVYNVGADYRLGERWSIGLSVAYSPLKTRITVAADNTAIGVPFKVITDVKSRTLATGLNVGYRF